MAKLSDSANTLVAVACVAIVYGTAFIGWLAWRTYRKFNSAAEDVASAAHSLREIMQIQSRQQEWAELRDTGQSRVNAVAMNIVFDSMEIFPADQQTGEIGIGVFTMRNVGNDPVFLLGLTRMAEDGIPPGPMRLLVAHGERDLNLRLEPGDPELDLDKVTVWYRDVRGQRWARSYGDWLAAPVPDADEDAAGNTAEETAALGAGSAQDQRDQEETGSQK